MCNLVQSLRTQISCLPSGEEKGEENLKEPDPALDPEIQKVEGWSNKRLTMKQSPEWFYISEKFLIFFSLSYSLEHFMFPEVWETRWQSRSSWEMMGWDCC